MFRLFLLYDLFSLSLSVSFFLLLFESVGPPMVFEPLCTIAPTSHGIYTPVWCIAASVHCNLWRPIICKVERVRSTSLFRSSICLTPSNM